MRPGSPPPAGATVSAVPEPAGDMRAAPDRLVGRSSPMDALHVLPHPPLRALIVAGKSLALLGLVSFARRGFQELPSRQATEVPQQLARAEDATDSGLAFVELDTSRDTYLIGEPFLLRLRFGFERECLRTGLVQLFPRPLDVSAQVFAPELEQLDGAQFLDTGEPPTGFTFALGERITRATRVADEERAGRTYGVFEYERRIAATRPGELDLAAPRLGFAHATRFRQDFVLGSVPLDR